MTIEEALTRTEALRNQSDKEWHPYLDMVRDALKRQDKSKWHDLRTDPEDLPPDSSVVYEIELFICLNGGHEHIVSGRWHEDIQEFAVNSAFEGTIYAKPLKIMDYMHKRKNYKGIPFYVFAWRYIE